MHSSNGTLKSLKYFFFSPRHFEFAFFFFLHLISLCGAQVGKVSRHTCIAYFAKSNNGSREKNIIRPNQDVRVCGYKVAILILLCSLEYFSLFMEILKKPFCENMGYLLFLSSFFLHVSLFLSSIFFYDSLMSLFTTKPLRERDQTYLEHLFWQSLTKIYLFTPGVGVYHFFLVDPKWNACLAPIVGVAHIFGVVYVILVLKA